MDPILEQFLGEARDNLDYLDAHLKDLENGDEESVNALFRAAHTLKGGAGLVGLVHVKEITHAAEDLLDAYRNHKIEYSPEMLDRLYDAFDEVIEIIDAVEESGELDVAVDEEHIEAIQKSVRAFLQETKDEEAAAKPVELPFMLDPDITLQNLTYMQLQRVAGAVEYDFSEITETFAQEEHTWVVDLNLGEDTIELGNDPFYLLSMLGEEKLLAVETHLYNPEDFSNPLALKTRMKVVCRSDVATLEDIFYNVIDELSAYPLTAQILLASDKESIENETFTTLLKELESEGLEGAEQKIKAALNVINPETKEGFIVERLYALSKVDSDLLQHYLKLLGVQHEGDQEVQKAAPQSPSSATVESTNSLSDKERETTLNILETQRSALLSGGAFERVKFLLKSVVNFLGVSKESIDAIEDEAALLAFVEEMIASLQPSVATEETAVQKEEGQKAHKRETEEVESQKSLQTQEAPKAAQEQHSATPKKEHKTHNLVPKTIKVDQEEIDILMDVVGEILVIKNSLPYIADSISAENYLNAKRELLLKYEEISRITEQLQDRVMGMRLLPLSYIFNRYPKLVREISKKLGKKIHYEEYGAETKLDKMMIEKLADPLIHIIRNSLDHGLESVEERKQAGKDETGTLTIGAKSEGDRVFIEIKDDGRGIDLQKVIHKALEKRLIEPEKLDTMSHEEKLALIFLPGLSTKEEITDLSGRGVGADAVRTTVNELGGKIHIESEPGRGTTIRLELPVSVALSNLFQIRMGDENYAIAMESVIETDKIMRSEIQTANHKPFIKLRKSIIPLVLSETLLKRKAFKEEENIILIKVADTQIAFIADELVGQIDVVQKPLSGVLKNHPYINGTALLGNGEPLFVLRPDAFVKVL